MVLVNSKAQTRLTIWIIYVRLKTAMSFTNSFELEYLGHLYTDKSSAKSQINNDYKTEVIDFLDRTFYQERDSENFVPLKTASTKVLRWCPPELHSNLKNLGLTNNQIVDVHGIIIGKDGNVFGHSFNIAELAQAADFPLEMQWAALWHDFGEIGLYFQGIHFDFMSGTKSLEAELQERLFRLEIAKDFRLNRNEISGIEMIVDKKGYYGKN